MADVLVQRCLHHPVREAVACCPECGQYLCRECITEHDDRVVCSSCLRKLTAKGDAKRRDFSVAWRVAGGAMGLLIAWIFFFLVGRVLLNIPSKFHEGTVWQSELLDGAEDDR